MSGNETTPAANFIRQRITEDIDQNKNNGKVMTRFPPEPNGYLHIGHAKSIFLNFGLADEFNGLCNLRFDDTNPAKEDTAYTSSIQEDVKWLGFDWEDRLHYTSNYFCKLYDFAVELIKKGKAYVCDLNADEIRKYRGTLTEPGQDSPFRDRSIDENLDLFKRMKDGEFADGTRLLRAKIDMTSPNLTLRDPALYRIKADTHHRTGDTWRIYPMYDFAHCLSDSIEGITHSLCTLEFENNRPLYDWILDQLEVDCHPQQIEFARLNLTRTALSKRKLIQLVENNYVDGWDDPRMPTIAGLRRKGYSPGAIRNFCERIGVAKRDSEVEMALLEFCVREDLNKTAPRVLGVLKPLKLVIENYPEHQDGEDELDAIINPEQPELGYRKVPFSRELYIEQDDFMEDPPKKYFRLSPGREVRLRFAYFVTCTGFEKDDDGNVTEVRCTYDPETRGGSAPDKRKVKGTIHWVSAKHALNAQVRLFDHLLKEDDSEDDFLNQINPDSLTVLEDCKLEPGLANARPGTTYQFERMGYFCLDSKDSSPESPVFNRTVTLRDAWVKKQTPKQGQKQKQGKKQKQRKKQQQK